MKTVDSYFVKFNNGTTAWLAAGKPLPIDADLVEVRPMLLPEEGMALKNKATGVVSSGHWLRGEDSADKWEEIPEPKEGEA